MDTYFECWVVSSDGKVIGRVNPPLPMDVVRKGKERKGKEREGKGRKGK